MPRTITFTELDPMWDFGRDSVLYYAIDNRVVVTCRIPVEVFYTHFGVRDWTAESCVRAFRDNRQRIQDVTRQKLLARPEAKQGDELVVLTDDFGRAISNSSSSSTTTTTPSQPPWHDRYVSTIDTTGVSDESLMQSIERANPVFLAEPTRRKIFVRAEWKLIPSEGGNLAKLVLIDKETGASAQRLYTRTDLENSEHVGRSFAKLYDDMLREKIRLLLPALDDDSGVRVS